MLANALLLSACAAVAAAQSAVLSFIRVPSLMTDGQPQALIYQTNETSTPVTILLRKGLSSDLHTVETITTSATGGQYIWTPSKSLADGTDYALEIKQGNQVNYFGPLEIQGANPSAVSSASASASASGSSSSGSSSGSATSTGTKNSTATSTTHSSTTTGHHNGTTTTTSSSHHTPPSTTTATHKTTVTPATSKTLTTTSAPSSMSAVPSATPTPTGSNGAVTLCSSVVLSLSAVAAFVFLV